MKGGWTWQLHAAGQEVRCRCWPLSQVVCGIAGVLMGGHDCAGLAWPHATSGVRPLQQRSCVNPGKSCHISSSLNARA